MGIWCLDFGHSLGTRLLISGISGGGKEKRARDQLFEKIKRSEFRRVLIK